MEVIVDSLTAPNGVPLAGSAAPFDARCRHCAESLEPAPRHLQLREGQARGHLRIPIPQSVLRVAGCFHCHTDKVADETF
jgi:hypothetical protein